ncbi:hypothetical protein CF326_g5314 [Tilletia indica]|nr:hypothetical protein CF326_g5314 [Tilletia indica]
MPRVARPARDVVIRVPKLLPYTKSSTNTRDAAASTSAVVVLDPSIINATHPASTSAAAAAAGGTEGEGGGAAITATATNGVGSGEELGNGGDDPWLRGVLLDGSSSLPIPQTQHSMLKAETSAAEWNSLLIWARRQRGPQWDTGTAIWQVDRHSQEYYSFCSNPTQNILVRLDTSAVGPSAPAPDARVPAGGAAAAAGSALTSPPTVLSHPSFPAEYDQHQHQHHPPPAVLGPGPPQAPPGQGQYILEAQPHGLMHGHGQYDVGGGGGGYGGMVVDGGGMIMMGNGHGQVHGNGMGREDSPPIVGPGRSARLRAGRA